MKQYRVGDCVNRDARFVMLADDEAEIEKARNEGFEKGLAVKMELNQGPLATIRGVEERARADERERIVQYIDKMLEGDDQGYAVREIVHNRLLGFIRGKPQEPKPLEKIRDVYNPDAVGDSINALVDAVNELRSK